MRMWIQLQVWKTPEGHQSLVICPPDKRVYGPKISSAMGSRLETTLTLNADQATELRDLLSDFIDGVGGLSI